MLRKATPSCANYTDGHKDRSMCYAKIRGGTTIAPIPAGARRHVMYCNACEVFLCVGCYEMYYTCHYLEPHIDKILEWK